MLHFIAVLLLTKHTECTLVCVMVYKTVGHGFHMYKIQRFVTVHPNEHAVSGDKASVHPHTSVRFSPVTGARVPFVYVLRICGWFHHFSREKGERT